LCETCWEFPITLHCAVALSWHIAVLFIAMILLSRYQLRVTCFLLKYTLQSWDMLSLLKEHQKQLLCNVCRISRDSVHLHPYGKHYRPFYTNSSLYSKFWYWQVSKYKLFLIQSIINNSQYHPNTSQCINAITNYIHCAVPLGKSTHDTACSYGTQKFVCWK